MAVAVGASICANKVAGVRAGLIHDVFSAHQGVEDDDMNVFSLGGEVIEPALTWEDVIRRILKEGRRRCDCGGSNFVEPTFSRRSMCRLPPTTPCKSKYKEGFDVNQSKGTERFLTQES